MIFLRCCSGVLGMVYINTGGTERACLRRSMPLRRPSLLLFFVSFQGCGLNLRSLSVSGVAGVAYSHSHRGQNHLCAYAGCARAAVCPRKFSATWGWLTHPQAGVSIGLAVCWASAPFCPLK